LIKIRGFTCLSLFIFIKKIDYFGKRIFNEGQVSLSVFLHNRGTESQTIGFHANGWELNEVAAHLDGPQEDHDEESGLMGDETEEGIVQKVLLTIYFNQLSN
jgi:hypothetical protein